MTASASVTRERANEVVARRPRSAAAPKASATSSSASDASGNGSCGGSTSIPATVGIGSSARAFSHRTVGAPAVSSAERDDSGSVTVVGMISSGPSNAAQVSVTTSGIPGAG
jgi:hypothetical protein